MNQMCYIDKTKQLVMQRSTTIWMNKKFMLSASSQSLRLVYFIIPLNEMLRFGRLICTEMRLVIVCDRNQRRIKGQELKDTGLLLLVFWVFFFFFWWGRG